MRHNLTGGEVHLSAQAVVLRRLQQHGLGAEGQLVPLRAGGRRRRRRLGAALHPQRVGRRAAVLLGDDPDVEPGLGDQGVAGFQVLDDAVRVPGAQQRLQLLLGGAPEPRVGVRPRDQRAELLPADVHGAPGHDLELVEQRAGPALALEAHDEAGDA